MSYLISIDYVPMNGVSIKGNDTTATEHYSYYIHGAFSSSQGNECRIGMCNSSIANILNSTIQFQCNSISNSLMHT